MPYRQWCVPCVVCLGWRRRQRGERRHRRPHRRSTCWTARIADSCTRGNSAIDVARLISTASRQFAQNNGNKRRWNKRPVQSRFQECVQLLSERTGSSVDFIPGHYFIVQNALNLNDIIRLPDPQPICKHILHVSFIGTELYGFKGSISYDAIFQIVALKSR